MDYKLYDRIHSFSYEDKTSQVIPRTPTLSQHRLCVDPEFSQFTYETSSVVTVSIVRIPDRRRRVGIRGIYGVRNERSKLYGNSIATLYV
jgi:hypothetical protein